MRLDLQEGFAGDAVEIRVNGRTVLKAEGVTSRRVVGLALSTEIEVSDGTLNIEIKIPTKNLSHTISVEASTTPNLGISIQDGQIKIITSERRFGYA